MDVASLGITEVQVLCLEPNGDFLDVTIFGTGVSGEGVFLTIPLVRVHITDKEREALELWAGLPGPVAFATTGTSQVVLEGRGYKLVLEAS